MRKQENMQIMGSIPPADATKCKLFSNDDSSGNVTINNKLQWKEAAFVFGFLQNWDSCLQNEGH